MRKKLALWPLTVKVSLTKFDAALGALHLINDLLSTLKDSAYFMVLSKKDRLNTTQKMRAFYSGLLKNYLGRINIIIQDPELLVPKQFNDPIPKHKGISIVFDILTIIKKDLRL